MNIFWDNGLLDHWLVYNNLHIKRLIFDPPAARFIQISHEMEIPRLKNHDIERFQGQEATTLSSCGILTLPSYQSKPILTDV